MEGKTDIYELKAAFECLQKRAKSVGLTVEDVASLQSTNQLRAPNKTLYSVKTRVFDWAKKWSYQLLATWIVFQALALSIWLKDWPVSSESIYQLYFDFYDVELNKESCLVDMPDILMDVTRPPVDCKFCHGVKEVDRRSKISVDEFETKYAYTGIPVVITDATANWTAKEIFSYDFFKGLYAEDSPVLRTESDPTCQFFPYKTNFENLAEVFNMSEERATLKDGSEPWYIGWSNCDSGVANVLRQHYSRPYFMPVESESGKTDWIFMGSPGYGAHMHIDNVGFASWQAQIKGVKKWTFEPPPECYHECVKQIEVIVNPGDIIVFDSNIWYHGTLIMGEEMSIVITTEFD